MHQDDALTYEEIRQIVIDLLIGRFNEYNQPTQYRELVNSVDQVLAKRRGEVIRGGIHRRFSQSAELVRDVFWDLFRQGFITLGLNDSNENWPFFRLSHFGQKLLVSQSPLRFHDSSNYLDLVRQNVPDISPVAISYLQEASDAFYAGCLLAATVMLGVAAEAEFIRLLDIAVALPVNGPLFSRAKKEIQISGKITKFLSSFEAIKTQLDRKIVEDMTHYFSSVQSILRIARNETGHPTNADTPSRELVYVYLQIFIPFARQCMRIRTALIALEDSCSQTL